MIINISEESLNKGLLAIAVALASGKLQVRETNNLAEFYHLLESEKRKAVAIELQEYDDANLLVDCLLFGSPDEILEVSF